ncbi:hypothetical protein B0T17DRAFT_599920 [Bombardia bombarda]|uniref:Uncharacterized protein n=1 Tax=Bombardia bombarda TaxID=252184 RepID=A0AA39X1E8_9PEZI|nr:hypothetical protein B0T17DRAFT_599920 [Bombardia bombarda]
MASPKTDNANGGGGGGGIKVINASLFRMGTKSMALTYNVLGFKTHHGLLEDVMDSPWTGIERAAEATWPSVWGKKFDIVTDLASPFAIELIKAYPDAKVVVVQRDFDKWWPSFKTEILDRVMTEPMATINGFIVWRVMGIRAVQAMRKVHFGFFGARNREEIARNARAKYDAYFDKIRRIVPEDRRLEYNLGDGWEPLCAFLGVPVPEGVEFPMANEKEAHQEEVKQRLGKFHMGTVKMFGPFILGLAVGVAGWMLLHRD